MAQIHWISQVNGSFQDGALWTGRRVPGAKDDAILDAAGSAAYTVTSSASQTVLSIQTASTATLSITSGAFVATNGTGSGANAGSILVGNNTSFTMAGAVDNTGLIALNAGGNVTDLIIGSGAVTLSGGGQITLGDNTNNRILGTDATSLLVNVDNIISGAGQLGAGALGFQNQAGGVVDATGGNALVLNVGSTAATNAGLLEASGAGGLVIQNSTVDDSGGGEIIANTASLVELENADIIGGVLATTGSGLIETIGASTLDGSTSAVDNQNVINIDNNTSLTILGKISNTGAIALDAGGNFTDLIISGAVTLKGGGQVILIDDANNRIYGGANGGALTNVDNTILGAGQLGVGQLTLDNQVLGVIDAVGTNALVLNVGSTAATNAGLLEASGTGGLLIQDSVIANTGGRISAATGAVVSLLSAEIIGGVLASVGSGTIETVDRGSLLDGLTAKVTIKGVVELLNNTALTIEGAIDNAKTIRTNTGGNLTDLIVAGANATLSGGGAVILNDDANNRLYGATATASLTNVDNTISGAGLLGNGQLALINQAAGVIDATGTNALVLNVGATAVTNDGLMEATGVGGLTIQDSTVDDAGGGSILAANASVVHLQSADIVGGAMMVAGSGVFQTTDGGTVLDGGGSHAVTVVGPLIIANNTALTIQGAISLTQTVKGVTTNGAIDINAGGNLTDLVVGANDATITGGAVTLLDNTNGRIVGTLTGSVVSSLTNKTLISGAGSIGANLQLINDTTIDADGAHALVIATGSGSAAGSNTVTNNGLLEATNPLALAATGGLLLSGVVIANAAGKGVIEANGAATHVDLQSATITGGVLESLKGGVIQTLDANSILDGTSATLTNKAQVDILNNTALTIDGAIDNADQISILAGGNLTNLVIGASNATLTGGGAITLADTVNSRLYGATAKARLVNVDNTISGAGQLGVGQLTLINRAAGVIDATGANALVLSVGPTAVANTGLIEGTGAGGLVIQNSTINNLGGVILAANGSVVGLQTADIAGGVLKVAGSGVFETLDGGSLLDGAVSAVANQGVVEIRNNTALTIQGAIDNTGSIEGLAGGNLTDLVIAAAGAKLSGAGEVTLDDDANNRIFGATAATTLTNTDNTIAGAGQLGDGQLTLVNQASGVIDATGVNNALVLNTAAETVTNQGLIEATGAAGLIVQCAVNGAAAGVLFAGTGSVISLQSADIIGGILKVAGTGLFQTIDGGTLLDGSTAKVVNRGQIDLLNNTGLTINGAIDNIGTVFFNGGGNLTDLVIDTAGSALSGGGHVTLNDDPNNRILGQTAASILTNVDNVISGAGQLGAGQMVFDNLAAGVVDATGVNALVLNTGAAAITNAGLMEASGAGGLTIQSAVDGGTTGEILANAGSMVSLQSADLVGGVLKTSGSGFFQTTDAGSLFDGLVSSLANQALVNILNNTALTLEGAITNSGQIRIDAGGNVTDLVISANNTALSGGGQVTLADDPNSRILGQSVTSLLDNVDNTISGAGQLGAGEMTLVNEAAGVIDATGANALVINTGTTTVTNIGLMEASGSGGLIIQSSVANTGTLEANGGNVVAEDAVAGSGSVLIVGGTADFAAAFTENVAFNAVAGELELAHSQTYSGNITGFSTHGKAGEDVLDAVDVGFINANEASFSGDSAGGVLMISDGVHTALINLVGNYTRSTFVASSDGAGGTLIVVNATTPIARADSYSTGAGRTLTTTGATGVLANDIDPNGLSLTAALAPGGGPSHGTLTLHANGSFIYVPNKGFAGQDSFTYIAHDAVGSTRPTTVTITVGAGGVTSNPDFYNDGAGQALIATAATGVLANDSDPNGLPLTAALAPGGGPSHGTLTLNADGSFTYTPTLGFAGKDTFSYIASDAVASGQPTLVTITVTAGTPTTKAETYGDGAGQALVTTAANGVLANDTDPNGLSLTAALAPGGGPSHGTLTLNADGSFTYTPTLGFAGKDSFTYIASDSLASSAATTVTIDVTAGTPTTKAETYGDGAGQALITTAANGVLANDTDPNGLSLTAALAPGGGPSHGTLTLNADGSFTYTPTLGFAGKDSFTYIASDSLASSAATTVTIDVTAGTPTTKAETYGDGAGQALITTAANGVLANDTDPNGLSLTAALAPGGGPSHGTLTLNADGSFTYTPTLGFAGKDSFTYIASDSLASSAATTVTIDVTAGTPTTKAETYGDGAGQALITTAANGVLANDTDPNGLSLTAALAPGGGPSHGTLTLNADGSFTYTPTLGFAGKDSFTYIASDSLASSAATTVTIDVTAGTPTGVSAGYSVFATQTLSTTAANGVLAKDTDPNGLSLTAALAPGGRPSHGTLTLNANGSFTYTPTAGYVGEDSFSYIASDSLASSTPITVDLNVVGRAPLTKPETYTAIDNHLLVVDAQQGVLAKDTDLNGRTLTAALAPGGGPIYGTLTLNADGSFTYILNSGFGGFTGVDTFTYIASDGADSSGPTVVTIDISNSVVVGASAAPAPAPASAPKASGSVAADRAPASPAPSPVVPTTGASTPLAHQFVVEMARFSLAAGVPVGAASETRYGAPAVLSSPLTRSAQA